MLITETDASKLWCPLVRHACNGETFNRGENTNYTNTSTVSTYPCTCIGSKCAGWRWKIEKTNFPAKGFCGFAGPVFID